MVGAFLTAEFAWIAIGYFTDFAPVWWGADARIYHRALELWVSGGNPYDAAWNGIAFAAPPITLLPLLPFALVSEDAFVWIMAGLTLCSTVWIVRKLHFAPYWLLFPPILEALIVGNPNVVVLALLLTAAAPIGVLLKIYGIVPLVGLLRTRAIVVTGLLILVTFPFLPWSTFVSLDMYNRLAAQASVERSAWGNPIEIILCVGGLLALGRERAAWLIVPALWPATQFHYSVLALPAIDPLMAAFMAIPLPGAAPAGIIASACSMVLLGRWRAMRDRRLMSADALTRGVPSERRAAGHAVDEQVTIQ